MEDIVTKRTDAIIQVAVDRSIFSKKCAVIMKEIFELELEEFDSYNKPVREVSVPDVTHKADLVEDVFTTFKVDTKDLSNEIQEITHRFKNINSIMNSYLGNKKTLQEDWIDD